MSTGSNTPGLWSGSASHWVRGWRSARLTDHLRTQVASRAAKGPTIVTTANIGRQMHLTEGAGRKALHWLELLDPGPVRPSV